MYLVAIAWMYVVLMVAVVEAVGGSVLGAVVTFLTYGLLPLGIVMYLMASPARRRLRKAEGTVVDTAPASAASPSSEQPDGSNHAASDALAAERKET